MSAFAVAVGALFADPNIGRNAVYIADGSTPLLVRVAARRADAVTDFGDARLSLRDDLDLQRAGPDGARGLESLADRLGPGAARMRSTMAASRS